MSDEEPRPREGDARRADPDVATVVTRVSRLPLDHIRKNVSAVDPSGSQATWTIEAKSQWSDWRTAWPAIESC